MNRTEAITLLSSLPADEEIAFNASMRKLLASPTLSTSPTATTTLEEIAFDSATDARTAFAAFMAALHIYRRRNKSVKMRSLLLRGEERFRAKRLFQLHFATAGATKNPTDYHTAISIARQGASLQPNEPGILNAFAELVARCLEDGILADRDGSLLREARLKSDNSIASAPEYAKYRATLARLMTLGGDLDHARKMIESAIELEDDTLVDYNVRLSNYLAIRQQIEHRRNAQSAQTAMDVARSEVTAVLANTKKELEESRTKNVEVLAFFSSIIALILTGAQEAKSISSIESRSVLILLAGVLLTAFAGLSVILYKPIQYARTLILAGLGAAGITISLLMPAASQAPTPAAPAAQPPISQPAAASASSVPTAVQPAQPTPNRTSN